MSRSGLTMSFDGWWDCSDGCMDGCRSKCHGLRVRLCTQLRQCSWVRVFMGFVPCSDVVVVEAFIKVASSSMGYITC